MLRPHRSLLRSLLWNCSFSVLKELDETWQGMRWILDALHYARDRQIRGGIPLVEVFQYSVSHPDGQCCVCSSDLRGKVLCNGHSEYLVLYLFQLKVKDDKQNSRLALRYIRLFFWRFFLTSIFCKILIDLVWFCYAFEWYANHFYRSTVTSPASMSSSLCLQSGRCEGFRLYCLM